MSECATDRRVYYILRVGTAMCFIGHGAFGIITKKVWLNYFAVFGIGPELGYTLMPLVGMIDIMFGISLLLHPTRAVWLWLIAWGLTTASLRPLSGEPFGEAVERAGNYGVPFVLLMLCGTGQGLRGWLSRAKASDMRTDQATTARAFMGLRIVSFLLLAGHGWLNLIGKPGLLGQYASMGVSDTTQLAHLVGAFEVIGALAILVRPVRPVIFGLLLWKMGSELFYPSWEVFEWIERGGSYVALLALYMMVPASRFSAVTWMSGMRTLQNEA